jgi:hypothetical protein
MAKITGGCACGAVRYEASGEPMAHAVCFCTDCQKGNGGAPTYGLVIAKDAFKLTKGKLASYTVKADSGGDAVRNFCKDCGTPVISGPAGAPITVIKVGTLDDASIFKPTVQIFTASARPWMHIDPAVPSVKGMM